MAIVDNYAGWNNSEAVHTFGEPPSNAAAVTPSDSQDLTNVTVAVYIGGTGDLVVVMAGGETVTFKAVPTGTWLWMRVRRIMSTGTTAINLVVLY